MPVEPVLTLIILAVLANLAVMGAVLLPPMMGRRTSGALASPALPARSRMSALRSITAHTNS